MKKIALIVELNINWQTQLILFILLLISSRRKNGLQTLFVGMSRLMACFPTIVLVQKRFTTISDRKSTRLNSSHVSTSYAVFCLKKKNITYRQYGFISQVLIQHCGN